MISYKLLVQFASILSSDISNLIAKTEIQEEKMRMIKWKQKLLKWKPNENFRKAPWIF